MKFSAILFFSAFAAMFAVDFLFSFRPAAEFIEMGSAHPQAIEFIKGLDEPIDATTGEAEERIFPMGFISRVDVNPGFRIIHDPNLGKEVIARGPAVALDLLSLSDKQGKFKPTFSKPLRLKKAVEIRVNLEAHGSKRMRISCVQENRQISLLPIFTTSGPLNFQFLEIVNLSADRVEVATRDLVVLSKLNTTNIVGKTERLEVVYNHSNDAELIIPGLQATQILRTDQTTEPLQKPRNTLSSKRKASTIDSLQAIIQALRNDTITE